MSGSNAFLEDVEHLQSLDPSFVSQVDLVLCAQDGSSKIGFPVHTAVIASHSPVLSRILKDLRETGNKQQPLRLPMVDDDCSALRDVLACVYGRLPRVDSQQGALTVSDPTVCLDSLETIQAYGKKMRLAYKYGMLGILQEQETSLMPALYTLVSPMSSDALVYTQREALVLETAIFAEDCKCARILAVSEAFIVKHFKYLAPEFAVSSRLSAASLLRVAQGVSIVGADTISKLQEALADSQTEARVFSRSRYEKGMICPGATSKWICHTSATLFIFSAQAAASGQLPGTAGSQSCQSQKYHSHFDNSPGFPHKATKPTRLSTLPIRILYVTILPASKANTATRVLIITLS